MPHGKYGNKTGKKSKTEQGIKFYRVPAVITSKGELIEKLTAERRRKWIFVISREDLTEKKLSNDQVCSVHFVSGKPAKNWDRHNQDWVPTLKFGHSKKSLNSSAAAAERNDRVLNRRKRALETELEKRNEKLKRLDDCGHTVDKTFTVTVCNNYEPSDEEIEEDRPVSDVSSANLELPSNISFGNSNKNLMNEEPTKSDAKTQTYEFD